MEKYCLAPRSPAISRARRSRCTGSTVQGRIVEASLRAAVAGEHGTIAADVLFSRTKSSVTLIAQSSNLRIATVRCISTVCSQSSVTGDGTRNRRASGVRAVVSVSTVGRDNCRFSRWITRNRG